MKTIIEKIEKYVADDGNEFDSKEKCQAYEDNKNRLKADEQKRHKFIEKVQNCKRIDLSSFEEFTRQYLYTFDSEEELIDTYNAFTTGWRENKALDICLPEICNTNQIKGKFTYPKTFIVNNYTDYGTDDPDVDRYDLYDLDLFKQRLQGDLKELS